MAVEYDGGVIIGADSRTTNGSYIANRVTDKLTQITEKVFCCRSGSAADTQAIADYVQYYMDFHAAETHSLKDSSETLVQETANVFRKLCYGNRDMLSAGIICAGYDSQMGGQVYSIPLGGMLVRQKFTIGGSGSGYIYGYCDANFRENMSPEECFQFVQSAVQLAMSRDGSSGGVVRMAKIDATGVERRVITIA